jgi:hypothetical protein
MVEPGFRPFIENRPADGCGVVSVGFGTVGAEIRGTEGEGDDPMTVVAGPTGTEDVETTGVDVELEVDGGAFGAELAI